VHWGDLDCPRTGSRHTDCSNPSEGSGVADRHDGARSRSSRAPSRSCTQSWPDATQQTTRLAAPRSTPLRSVTKASTRPPPWWSYHAVRRAAAGGPKDLNTTPPHQRVHRNAPTGASARTSAYTRWSGGPIEKGSRCDEATEMTPAQSGAGAYSLDACNAMVVVTGRIATTAHPQALQQFIGRVWCCGALGWCPTCSMPHDMVAILAIIAGCHATNEAITTTAVDVLTTRDRCRSMADKVRSSLRRVKSHCRVERPRALAPVRASDRGFL